MLPLAISRNLSSWASRLGFLVATGAVALALAIGAARAGVAGSWGESLDTARVEKAVQLDPGNGALHYRLGQLYGWGALDSRQAMLHLRRAVELSPGRALYWWALGWACFNVGDQNCSSEAFRKAVQLAPMSPQVYWELANYLTITASEAEVLPVLGHYLQLNQQMERPDPLPAFRLFDRAFEDSNGIWELLSSRPELGGLKMPFIQFIAAQGRTDLAVRHWDELAATYGRITLADATLFLKHLLDKGRYAEAAGAWKKMQEIGLVSRKDDNEVVFNGGFERLPLNTAFDWQYEPKPYVHVNFSATPAHDGNRCLEVEYTAPDNSESEPVYELVPVNPNQRYRLTAYARSSAITSDSGPRLRVVDPECRTCLDTATDGTIGTTPWHQLSTDFTAGPNAHVALISVWRPRSRTYPMDITGDFRLDSVSLIPQPGETAK